MTTSPETEHNKTNKKVGTHPKRRLKTVPLADLLKHADAPAEIDYLSLDVAGAEALVLDGFPFDRYTFKVCVN